jgi:transcriptional regulator with XRE-family HTH domain
MNGTLLKEIRTAKKIGVSELAAMVGVGRATIWGLEKGTQKPSANLLFLISKALGVEMDIFFENKVRNVEQESQ